MDKLIAIVIAATLFLVAAVVIFTTAGDSLQDIGIFQDQQGESNCQRIVDQWEQGDPAPRNECLDSEKIDIPNDKEDDMIAAGIASDEQFTGE